MLQPLLGSSRDGAHLKCIHKYCREVIRNRLSRYSILFSYGQTVHARLFSAISIILNLIFTKSDGMLYIKRTWTHVPKEIILDWFSKTTYRYRRCFLLKFFDLLCIIIPLLSSLCFISWRRHPHHEVVFSIWSVSDGYFNTKKHFFSFRMKNLAWFFAGRSWGFCFLHLHGYKAAREWTMDIQSKWCH